MMQLLGVIIALLLAIGLPVVRADDGEECMGDVVYCFMVVIYAMAMGTFSSFMRSPPVQSPPPRTLAHKASPAFLLPSSGIPIVVWAVRKSIQFREQRRARIEAAMHADIMPL